MRFRKRYFVIGGLAALAILCSLLMLSMFPPRGAEQDCDTSRGGKSVAINGHIMWYDVYGKKKDKTPIYILAGGPGFSSEYIEPYIRFLAEKRTVVLFDGRCSGRSEYTADLSDCTYENYGKDLEELRKRITPDKDILILAHSGGGVTAMEYMTKYEEHVKGVIFVSSLASKTNTVYSDQYLRTGFPPFNQKYANAWFSANIRELYGEYIANKDVVGILDHCAINYALMMKNNAKDQYDYSEKLEKSQIPALVLYGRQCDVPMADKTAAQNIHGILENSQMYGFDSSGHFCFAEEPQLFKKKVNRFINEIEKNT